MKELFLALAALVALSFSACSKEETLGSAKLNVRLTDAPADYQAVYIDFQRVEVNAGRDEKSEWISLKGMRPGIYDLLKLTNGLDTLLANDELPAGNISQIRLVLGENNSLQIKGKQVQLKTPGAAQSGLIININTKLQEGVIYTLLLDFDAARSIVEAGNSDKYILKPVIRSILEAQSGAIKGNVSPSGAASVVYAIAGSDSVSTYTNESGGFLLRGLKAGNYRLVFPVHEGYQAKTLENIRVTPGVVSFIENIVISSK